MNWRRVVLATVATVAVLGGFRACAATADRPEGRPQPESSAPSPTKADEGPGPSTVRAGVPAGWSPDEDGALAAAVSAVRMTGPIARAGFITRADMIDALATARYGPVLASESAAQLEEMRGELATAGVTVQAVELHELPLTAHVVSSGARVATVEVWAVTVIVVPEVAAPRQVWRTVTVELAWEAGDWRIDGWSTRAGPTPALATGASIAADGDALEVLSWEPVRIGGG